MRNNDMGRVLAEATIENLQDLWDAQRELLPPGKVRRVVVKDALVDTGATSLAIPKRLIKQLGLTKSHQKHAISSKGKGKVNVYQAVRLTILGRDMTVDVLEVPNDVPVLIGQIPLEMLDLVVDVQGKRLTGNPAHGGEHVLELY